MGWSLEARKDIDVLKGLGIITVVVGHMSGGITASIMYLFHMPLFFYLSGALYKKSPPKEYLQKKVRHLLVPYCIYLLSFNILAIGAFTKKMILDPSWEMFDFYLAIFYKNLYGGVKLVEISSVFWFITCLFFTQQLYNLIENCTSNTSRKFIILTLCYVLALLNQFYFSSFRLPWALNVSLCAIAFFGIGHHLKFDYFKNIKFILTASIVCIIAIACLIKGYPIGYNMKYGAYGLPLFSILTALSFIVLIYVLSNSLSKRGYVSTVLVHLGNASMTIMFLHELVHLRLFGSGDAYNPIMLVFVSTLIPFVIFQIQSKIPILRGLFLGEIKAPKG